MKLISASSALFLVLMASFSVSAAQDARKVKGPEACVECHKRSNDVWQSTPHYKTFNDMPVSKEGKEIAEKMGVQRIKSEPLCMECHATHMMVEGKSKALTGVSCESCHGEGADYIKIHADYGGKDVKKEQESPEHAKLRYAQSEAGGMIRPTNYYKLARECFACHINTSEKLVNQGGHTAASKGFELVAWSQGLIRHNNWYNAANAPAPLERQRMLYVVGKMTDMEYTLKALGKSTTKDEYVKAMVMRYRQGLQDLEDITTKDNISEVSSVLATAKAVQIKLNNAGEMNAAAQKISQVAQNFSAKNDGSNLGALDPLLPTEEQYKGKALVQ